MKWALIWAKSQKLENTSSPYFHSGSGVPIKDDLKTFRPKIGNITFELQIGNFEMRSKNRLPLSNLMFRNHL